MRKRDSLRKKKTAIFVRSKCCAMPRHCSAAGCKSRDTRETRKAGITFHRLPKRGSPRRTQWIINSRRKDPQGKGQWDPQSHFIYFCSKHFTPESFELSGVSGYRRLKEDALPTVFETFSRQRHVNSEKGRRKNKQTRYLTALSPKHTKVVVDENDQQKEESCADARNITNGNDSVTGDTTEKINNLNREERAEVRAPSLPLDESPFPSSVSCGPPLINQDAVTHSEAAVHSCLQTHPPSTGLQPSSPPQPPSPSCYMRRLPPPPGFHLAREHSYAQLCPLVWRKRYDRAIESLEKSLRLLHAARRRETRLRQTLLRLRENRVRQTLLNLRAGPRWKEAKIKGKSGLESQPKRNVEPLVRQGNVEREAEIEKMAEDLNLFDEEAGDSGDGVFPASALLGMQEETGFCLYCGRGQEYLGGNERGTVGRSQIVRQSQKQGKNGSWCDGNAQNKGEGLQGITWTKQKAEIKAADTEAEACCYYYYSSNTGSEQSDGDVQIVAMELAQGWQVHPGQQKIAELLQSKMGEQTAASLQVQNVQVEPQPEQQVEGCVAKSTQLGTVQAVPQSQNLNVLQPMQLEMQKVQMQLQNVQLLQQNLTTQPKVIFMDSTGEEGGWLGEGEQQQFWMQEDSDGRLLLVQVPKQQSEKYADKNEKKEPLLMSVLGFQSEPAEESQGSYLEPDSAGQRITGQSEKDFGHPTEAKNALGGGDLREKLKEHLEGFQLQLSSEFLN
ncbi:THAP domain-containing protein 7 isoform X1 [Arapaima gigas]